MIIIQIFTTETKRLVQKTEAVAMLLWGTGTVVYYYGGIENTRHLWGCNWHRTHWVGWILESSVGFWAVFSIFQYILQKEIDWYAQGKNERLLIPRLSINLLGNLSSCWRDKKRDEVCYEWQGVHVFVFLAHLADNASLLLLTIC